MKELIHQWYQFKTDFLFPTYYECFVLNKFIFKQMQIQWSSSLTNLPRELLQTFAFPPIAIAQTGTPLRDSRKIVKFKDNSDGLSLSRQTMKYVFLSLCKSWRGGGGGGGDAEAVKILIKTVNIQGRFNGNGPFGIDGHVRAEGR